MTLALVAGLVALWSLNSNSQPTAQEILPPRPVPPSPTASAETPRLVRLSSTQQAAIGLETAKVQVGESIEIIAAPGRVTPDEAHYAYITPRVAGVVRSVAVQIGRDVRAGELLATLDSPEFAQARLDLLVRKQELEVAQTRADWQASITTATIELIERLAAGDSPQEIQKRFEGRPVGENRERLLTADSQRRVTHASMLRNQELLESKAVSLAKYQVVVAEYEAALATYQSLMDRVGVEARLANTRAQQDRRQAETAVRVARARLKALGVDPESDEVQLQRNSVADTDTESQPMSTYMIRAPFDGTILDREMIVPGVAVGTTHRIFTIADLRTVWIEANVHESQFGLLARSEKAGILIHTPAYPGREFPGEVIYTGDLVDEKSRTVKLLARAENPHRLLKPGMYVDVKIKNRSGRKSILIPDSALLSEGINTFVYVRTGPEQFEARQVIAGQTDSGQVEIDRGLDENSEVVTEGAFKLKAEALRLSAS